MQNYTHRELLDILRTNGRGRGLCFNGMRFLLSYATVNDAFQASTQPGWMRALLKVILWPLMTGGEQSSVDVALAATGITSTGGYVDELKADELRAALPDFFEVA